MERVDGNCPTATVGEAVRDTPAYVRCAAALEGILGPKDLWYLKSTAEMRAAFRSVPGNRAHIYEHYMSICNVQVPHLERIHH